MAEADDEQMSAAEIQEVFKVLHKLPTGDRNTAVEITLAVLEREMPKVFKFFSRLLKEVRKKETRLKSNKLATKARPMSMTKDEVAVHYFAIGLGWAKREGKKTITLDFQFKGESVSFAGFIVLV